MWKRKAFPQGNIGHGTAVPEKQQQRRTKIQIEINLRRVENNREEGTKGTINE